MISSFEEAEKFFVSIGSKLKKPVIIYIIGGIALMYHRAKETTKDVDLVTITQKEYNDFRNALMNDGFISRVKPLTHEKFATSDMLIKEEFRIDLFFSKVCGTLELSQGMAMRAKPVLKTGNLDIRVCSKEDILVFKLITDREGDKEDCKNIIEQIPDWNVIFSEIKSQIDNSGQNVWITYIQERLDEFEDKGAIIPIIKKTRALAVKYYKDLDRRQKEESKKKE